MGKLTSCNWRFHCWGRNWDLAVVSLAMKEVMTGDHLVQLSHVLDKRLCTENSVKNVEMTEWLTAVSESFLQCKVKFAIERWAHVTSRWVTWYRHWTAALYVTCLRFTGQQSIIHATVCPLRRSLNWWRSQNIGQRQLLLATVQMTSAWYGKRTLDSVKVLFHWHESLICSVKIFGS